MKKIFALLLALIMVFALCACGSSEPAASDPVEESTTPVQSEPVESEPADADADPVDPQPEEDAVTVMSYAEYIAADLDTLVVVDTYVQGKQSWWDNRATVYTQNEDGAFFCYDMACSEKDYAKLTVGTKIRVTGYKGEWAGEVEIMDATFEILEGSFVATPVDATAWLNTDELIAHQNELAIFKGMTVESIEYKNGEPGDDIYVTLSKDGVSYSFCVEVYLTGPDTEVYQTVGTLAAGDVVDVTGFIYWYEGVNTHIIDVAAAN